MRGTWLLASLALGFGLAGAEDGSNAWLRYARLPDWMLKQADIPSSITVFSNNQSSPVYTAGLELQKGISGVLGQDLSIVYDDGDNRGNGNGNGKEKGKGKNKNAGSIIIATVDSLSKTGGGKKLDIPELEEDGFWLDTGSRSSSGNNGKGKGKGKEGGDVRIIGQNERGALYGAFAYLSMLAQGNFSSVAYASNPSAGIRWVNQWDNMDGTIERGYAGLSIFFGNNTILPDIKRVGEYARLLASVGVNGIIVNNVNANPILLSDENMKGLKRVADAMRPWGVRVGISLNFASPQTLGGLSTFDPLDKTVIAWWGDMTSKLYGYVPDMAGYLVKANSEGQPGPLTYNRTLADGANLFARALKPHGGIVMFRAFVYDSKNLRESNWKDDRANAAVDFFRDLDDAFDANVVVQVKYGPIDFQVREPVSPLFAHLKSTASAIELQITQEYLGQQCHLVYLPPLWKTILDFDLRVDGQKSVVGTDILSGKRFGKGRLTGYAAVVNVGRNATWLGTHLAMSNLYAYGKLAWDPTVDEVAVLEDWTRLTFGFNQKVIDTITSMSMQSWPAYENYTGNLGVQTLTDITYNHYGPNPQSMDNNPWGQWTRADAFSIGMDRTVSNGTGYAGQYPSAVASLYESPATTPDELLLWFHHVPYTHVLKSSGKTVIQHFYDAHYDGAATASRFPAQWSSLRGLIDDQRFDEMLFRLEYQAGHAIVWRDNIAQFYHAVSSIPDQRGRVNKHPWRIEAESFPVLHNYKITGVNPFQAASGVSGNYKIIQTTDNSTAAYAQTAPLGKQFAGDGTYDVAVAYYDLYEGQASYKLLLNGKVLGAWKGDLEDRLGYTLTRGIDAHSATRITFKDVRVKQGDVLRVETVPHGRETAPLDYIAVLPAGIVD